MRQRTLAERARVAREEAQKASPPRVEAPGWEELLQAGRPAVVTGPVRHEIPNERRLERAEEMERMQGALPPATDPGVSPRYGLTGAPYLSGEISGEERLAAERMGAPEEGLPMRPAWLTERESLPVQVPVHLPPTEPLQPSQERVTPRWFALRGILGRNPDDIQPERVEGQVPVLAIFSLAGGVGKTSLVASIGRGLAARGERVLLTDTCSFGVLPFYFGAREVKPGVVRTFSGATSDPPIRVLTLEAERYEADPDLLRREMARGSQDSSRVVIDVATGSAAMLRQAARMAPTVLVPVVPDLASVVTLQSLDGFFRNQEGLSGKPLQAWFVLNQFDPSSPLQLDVREVLRQMLGDRLLPFAVRRSPAMSEALAEGMTVLDYAPNSPAAEDVMSLVTWIRTTSAAMSAGHRGVRWSER